MDFSLSSGFQLVCWLVGGVMDPERSRRVISTMLNGLNFGVA